MLINHSQRFVYLAIPRTGSTSILRCLYKCFPDSIKAGHHRMDVPVDCYEYYIFTTVRNPYKRLLSHYRHRYRYYKELIAHWSFDEYVKNIVNERMKDYKLNNDPPCCKYPFTKYKTDFIKIEDMNERWSSLPFWEDFDNDIPILPVKNKSNNHGLVKTTVHNNTTLR